VIPMKTGIGMHAIQQFECKVQKDARFRSRNGNTRIMPLNW
jgi:hypothetical protein